jgi:hypothetical protein
VKEGKVKRQRTDQNGKSTTCKTDIGWSKLRCAALARSTRIVLRTTQIPRSGLTVLELQSTVVRIVEETMEFNKSEVEENMAC